jgi:hypothetical protein
MKDLLRRIWGTDQSKGFKRQAWLVALAAFGVMSYFEYKKSQVPQITYHGHPVVPPKKESDHAN